MTHDGRALATNDTAMLLYGLSAVLVGPTLPGIIDTLDLNLAQAGFVSSAQNAGGLAGALVALLVANRLPRARTVVVSFGMLALALLSVSFAGRYAPLIVAFAASGLFIRILDVMLNAHTGEIAGARSGPAMSILHMFFSIGAFVGPLVAHAVLAAGASWSQVYRYVGLAYLVVVLVSTRWLRGYLAGDAVDGPAHSGGSAAVSPAPDAESAGATDRLAGHPRRPRRGVIPVMLLGGALFFYAVHQIGLSSWVPYFLESARLASPAAANFALSLYWLGIIAGRFVASRVVERIGTAPVLVVGCFVSAAATLGAVLVPGVGVAQALLVVAGLSSGATIPLAYSMGYRADPARTASVTAVMSVIMLAGRFLSPWAIGLVADATTITWALVIPGVALVATGALVAAARSLGPG